MTNSLREAIQEIIVDITRDHDTDTLEEVSDKYIDKIISTVIKEIRGKMPEKQIPYWRSHIGDEIDHARAIGFDEAISDVLSILNEMEKGE